MPTAEVCRKLGLSQCTFYKSKSKFGGKEESDAVLRNSVVVKVVEAWPVDALSR